MNAQSVETRGAAVQPISAEERERLIAAAAYSRAQRRNFVDGDPVADWLEAEREIDGMMPSAQQQQEEAIVYEKLWRMLRNTLAELQEAVNEQTVRQAFDQATEEIKKTGVHTAETIGRIAASLRKDMAHAAQRIGPELGTLSERSTDLFGIWRDRSNRFLAESAQGIGEWLQQTGTKLEQQTYKAGEMVYQGVFACVGCNERIELSTSGHLSPCPKCHATEYRRA